MTGLSTSKLIPDITLIVLSLIFAAVFKKHFNHIYRTGHENLIKSFVWGAVCAILFAIFVVMGIARSENLAGIMVKFMVIVYPVLAVGFSTGSTLLLGIIGLGGGKMRYVDILIVGGVMLIADMVFPMIGSIIYNAVFYYGLGATVLSFFTPMKEEEGVFFQDGTGGENSQERLSLKGDITPILPSRKDPSGE